MATFVEVRGMPYESDHEDWFIGSVRWPAGYFDDDPRFERTDPFWADYRGTLTKAELLAFREQHGLAERDWELDGILASDWDGRVFIRTGEWESGGA